MHSFQDEVVKMLRVGFKFTLISRHDYNFWSRNHVNVPITNLFDILYVFGVEIYRVSFFGIKWNLPSAKLLQSNLFDIAFNYIIHIYCFQLLRSYTLLSITSFIYITYLLSLCCFDISVWYYSLTLLIEFLLVLTHGPNCKLCW